MDFVSDQTVTGEWFRAHTIVDVLTRECLAIEPGRKLGGAEVVATLDRVVKTRGAPVRIHRVNSSEFAGHLVDLGFYPDFTDTLEKRHNVPEECLCQREESSVPSSNVRP
jgi:hypothetical protein